MTLKLAIGNLTVIEIVGDDRRKIANNLITQDARTLSDGDVVETFVTDVKGRTLCHGLLSSFHDRLWFVSSAGYGPLLNSHIDRYIIREDASVVDVSQDWQAYLFSELTALLDQLGIDAATDEGSPPPHQDFALRRCWSVLREGIPAIAMQVPWLPNSAGLALLPPALPVRDPWHALRESCESSDTHTRLAWERKRIEAFWPWFGVDCDARNLPQEMGIDARAISFKKGCYLGQETVARLDALGQVQKRMVLLWIEGESPVELPCPMTVDNKDIGTITSSAMDGRGNRLGLAMVRRPHLAIGTEWRWNNRLIQVLAHEAIPS